jgi:copper(I)-binding protein
MPRITKALMLLLIAPTMGLAGNGLLITDPWSPEAPPGRMMAGFLTLENTGAEAVALIDGKSPKFGHVEIHTMVMDEGVMRMRKLDELVIEPGEVVQLKPGGLHLMLMQPAQSFEAGQTIDITLFDKQGNQYDLVSEVRKRNRPMMTD